MLMNENERMNEQTNKHGGSQYLPLIILNTAVA